MNFGSKCTKIYEPKESFKHCTEKHHFQHILRTVQLFVHQKNQNFPAQLLERNSSRSGIMHQNFLQVNASSQVTIQKLATTAHMKLL